MAKKTRILDVVYNASNNELVRTKTLVKSAIVQVDATPFRQFYEQHYGQEVGKKKKAATAKAAEGEVRCLYELRVCVYVFAILFPCSKTEPGNQLTPPSISHAKIHTEQEVGPRAAQAGEAQGRH